MKNNRYFIAAWVALTVISGISLLSLRYEDLAKVEAFHYRKEYLIFLFVYCLGVMLVLISLLRKAYGGYAKIANISGTLVLIGAGIMYVMSMAYDFTILPFAFPVQLLLSILFSLYIFSSRVIFFNVFISLILFLITLKAFDISLSLSSKKITNLPGQQLEDAEKHIQTFELYPYTGWHMQSNYHHVGEAPFEKKQPYSDYDIKTGSMGFFIDFDPENPPKKEANEFRIILIGGSGAQGWGGQTNDDMLYKQLEKQLNHKLIDTKKYVRVINLAMAGTITYQNYIALNRWGHFLEPDLILSYSGRNEYVEAAYIEGSDAFQYFNALNGLAIATRGSEFSPSLAWIKKIFPNIMTRTNIGVASKILFSNKYFYWKARKDYTDNRNIDCTSKISCVEKVAIPTYIHALKSIKRDFTGIPIMVAWQAVGKEEVDLVEKDLGRNFYNKMFTTTQGALSGYINNQWYFLNIHKMLEKDPKPTIDIHLGNEGHKMVADIIAEQIEKVIREKR